MLTPLYMYMYVYSMSYMWHLVSDPIIVGYTTIIVCTGVCMYMYMYACMLILCRWPICAKLLFHNYAIIAHK